MRFLLRPIVLFILITAGSGYLCAQTPSKKQAQNSTAVKKLATIDGVAITETQARMEGASGLASLELQVLKAKATAARNEQEILESAVERLIEDKLLRAEAAKQGISKEELLSREVQKKVTEPTAEEIDDFYTENKQRISRSKEEATPQISKILKQQQESNLKEAFLGRLEQEHHVVRLLEPLRYNVSAAGRPSIGPAAAPVVLVEFSDFQCPYCKRFSATIKEVLKQYGNKVRLVFRQFPLTNIHANAQRAAEASLCADAQGRFWEMHDLLFENQNSLKDEDLKSRASKLGLDIAAFNACLDSKRYGAKIDEDMRSAAAVGVDGTPALFINGRFLYGSRPFEDIAEIIDQELKGKKQ
jgi:predicted DsbA family dithiol-disulfide isomerase